MSSAIAVLVAGARHPLTGRPQRSPVESAALEIALRLAPRSTVLIHAGSTHEHVLPWYACAGEVRAIHVQVAPERDPSLALAEAVREEGVRIALCGVRAVSGFSSGLTPYRLAAALGWPVVPAANEASLSDAHIVGMQALPGGRRRELRCEVPAVVTIAGRSESLPFAWARFRDARVEIRAGAPPLDTWRDRTMEDVTVRSAAWDRRLFDGSAAERLSRILEVPLRAQELVSGKDPQTAARAVLDFVDKLGVLERPL